MSDIDLESNIGGANYDINDYSQGNFDNLIGENRDTDEEGEGMIDQEAAEMYSCMGDEEEIYDEAEQMQDIREYM